MKTFRFAEDRQAFAGVNTDICRRPGMAYEEENTCFHGHVNIVFKCNFAHMKPFDLCDGNSRFATANYIRYPFVPYDEYTWYNYIMYDAKYTNF